MKTILVLLIMAFTATAAEFKGSIARDWSGPNGDVKIQDSFSIQTKEGEIRLSFPHDDDDILSCLLAMTAKREIVITGELVGDGKDKRLLVDTILVSKFKKTKK